ncbi:galactose ABC transporter substrate-binding protein [Brachyspira innocens]|uniref:D-galactose/methyl-galactoside binding periplasmic protein MglB n=1 Tax=Brachyspira innocens TaxID=13264 RepID=A0ABT8Z168_9SPIR|nr:galactose ABC transporter substrate-binding protein [Brachyspira innocens]MDO6993877.1 galactose ABC transporter substrate-binding protein [Brachyspira innocens]MDO7021169.1 galactose ABC transporter substrate-binding protein [Brachyspira innocens]
MGRKILLLLIILTSFIISSCSENKNNNSFIGITVYRTDDPFANSLKSNIEKFISGRAKYIVNDSQNNQTTQNSQVDNYISKGSKVLVINLVDTQAAQDIVDKAKKSDIPIILFNKAPDLSVMNSYDKVWYVGTLSEEAVNLQGKIITDSWKSNPSWDKNGDGKIQCVILEGEPGHADTKIRTENLISFIENSGIELEILDKKTAMWNRDRAKTIVDSWMSNHNNEDSDTKIEYIFSNNDEMALGALKSVQGFGYNKGESDKFIPIVGIDAIDETIKEIEKGNIVGTVLNDSVSQAKAVSDLALNLFKGETSNPILGTAWTLDNTKSVRVHYKPITIELPDTVNK